MPLLAGALLLIRVWFDGVPVNCVVDTGAQSTVVRASAAARIGTLSRPLAAVKFRLVNATALDGTVHTVPHVGTSFFGWNRAAVVVVPDGDLREDCYVGQNLLAQQDLVIDWRGGEVRPTSPTRPD